MKPSTKVLNHVLDTLDNYNQWYENNNDIEHGLSKLSINLYNIDIYVNGHRFSPGFLNRRKIRSKIDRLEKQKLQNYKDFIDDELISDTTIFQNFPDCNVDKQTRIVWLAENDITEYTIYGSKIAFKNNEDALAYKLMWEKEESANKK